MGKIITLSGTIAGDNLKIKVYRKNIHFEIECDGAGFTVQLPREEMRRLLND